MDMLVIRANETSAAVSITIIDDELAEDKLQPVLTVTARVEQTPISQFFTRTITILDNDGEREKEREINRSPHQYCSSLAH